MKSCKKGYFRIKLSNSGKGMEAVRNGLHLAKAGKLSSARWGQLSVPVPPPSRCEDWSRKRCKFWKDKDNSMYMFWGQFSKAPGLIPFRFLIQILLDLTLKTKIPATWPLEGRQVAPGFGPLLDIWSSGLLSLSEYLSDLPSRVVWNSKCQNLCEVSLKIPRAIKNIKYGYCFHNHFF